MEDSSDSDVDIESNGPEHSPLMTRNLAPHSVNNQYPFSQNARTVPQLVSCELEPEEMIRQPTKRKKISAKSVCPHGCGKPLSRSTIRKHKKKGCFFPKHPKKSVGESKKKLHCCGACFMKFTTRKAFFNHLAEEHDVCPSVHQLTFESKEIFNRFLRWLEAKGGAHFRHKSGSKDLPGGKGLFMACNRSGCVGDENLDPLHNKTGNYRTGYSCTAFIHGKVCHNGTVEIEFCGDHYGHNVRMRLPNIIKYLIAQMQMDGSSYTDIINYLQGQFSPLIQESYHAERICQVNSDELRNLLVHTTKKFEDTGIPTDCEIWEEELLEKAGIYRGGVPSVRQEGNKSTEELAIALEWPHPNRINAKVKINGVFMEFPELTHSTAETRRDSLVNRDYTPPDGNNQIVESKDESPRKKAKIDVISPPPSSLTDSPPQHLSTRRITNRSQCIEQIENEIISLVNIIQENHANTSGTFLVAFMSKVKQLKDSYINCVNDQKESDERYARSQQELEEFNQNFPEYFEDGAAAIGIDYPYEDELNQSIIEQFNEQVTDPSKKLKFNPAIWK